MTAKRVLIVGLGNMGLSHAVAYDRLDSFSIAAICNRHIRPDDELPAALRRISQYTNFDKALHDVKPDCVAICSWPDTHAEFAIQSMRAGAHVFLEKPLAETVEDAREVVDVARQTGCKLVIGYILRHHPSWRRFVEIARTLGKPLVMRMNLNQQSSGENWNTHKQLMKSLSPIVDCGVHYVDMMCLMTGARPLAVHAVGARLSDEIGKSMYNYGHLQVTFDDTSVGWYEAGWGPMMSETAFFVKDVNGPRGSVSIRGVEDGTSSADVNAHVSTNRIQCHFAELDEQGRFIKDDEIFNMRDEPDHYELCAREQAYFAKAIEEDLDLGEHLQDAINSLRIVLAADESIRTGCRIELDEG